MEPQQLDLFTDYLATLEGETDGETEADAEAEAEAGRSSELLVQ